MREVNFGWLREAVRKEIRNAFEVQGYARPREVAQVVCALYRKGVSQMGERLVENAIAAMARRELKRYPATTECTQLRVSGIPGALMAHLPPAISVPASGVDEEALSEDSVIYKPLSRAALADIDAHLELLAAFRVRIWEVLPAPGTPTRATLAQRFSERRWSALMMGRVMTGSPVHSGIQGR